MLVQKLRLQHGWSQQQLAELSDLSVRTVQRIEQGKDAGTESLKSLASVFEIDFSTLLSEQGMDNNDKQGLSSDEFLAFKQERKLRRFYIHLTQYVLVVSCLAIVNLVQTPGRLWVLWVAFGWGIGILSHAMATFKIVPFIGADWEKRQVEKRLGWPL